MEQMLQCFSHDPLNKVFKSRIIGSQLTLEKMSQDFFHKVWKLFLAAVLARPVSVELSMISISFLF